MNNEYSCRSPHSQRKMAERERERAKSGENKRVMLLSSTSGMCAMRIQYKYIRFVSIWFASVWFGLFALVVFFPRLFIGFCVRGSSPLKGIRCNDGI